MGCPFLPTTAAEACHPWQDSRLQEMLASSNLALSLSTVLTQSAIELLLEWGSDVQLKRYLPKLLQGEWSGTMDLTEPEAGSDLTDVRTRAVRDEEQGCAPCSGNEDIHHLGRS